MRAFASPLFTLVLLVALAPAQPLAAPARPHTVTASPSPAPSPDPCAQALALEKKAADALAKPSDAYDAARSGLDINEQCSDMEMHLITKGYLLSMLAMSEHALEKSDWREHFLSADTLLVQCQRLKNVPAPVLSDCKLQQGYNRSVAARWAGESYPSPPPR